METDKRQWRFFTRLKMTECIVKQYWCWEVTGPGRTLASAGVGFSTLPAAMHDASLHGFTGVDQAVEGRLSLRRAADWSVEEQLLPLPFEWLNTGGPEFPCDGEPESDGSAAARAALAHNAS